MMLSKLISNIGIIWDKDVSIFRNKFKYDTKPESLRAEPQNEFSDPKKVVESLVVIYVSD